MKRFLLSQNDGFTLVELLIVVAIIGIIAAIAIPNLLSAIQRGKQKRTMGDIKTVASTIEQYNIDNNSTYPLGLGAFGPVGIAAGTGINLFGAGATQLDSSYLATPIFKDGWYTAATPTFLQYGVDGSAATPSSNYVICSFGKNGLPDTTFNTQYVCGATVLANIVAGSAAYDGPSFNCDIVIVDGQFMRGPIGKQSQALC